MILKKALFIITIFFAKVPSFVSRPGALKRHMRFMNQWVVWPYLQLAKPNIEPTFFFIFGPGRNKVFFHVSNLTVQNNKQEFACEYFVLCMYKGIYGIILCVLFMY